MTEEKNADTANVVSGWLGWLGVGIAAAAAFVIGAVVSYRWQTIYSYWAIAQGVGPEDLAVVLLAVVAAIAASVLPSRSARRSSIGWLLATGALAALAILDATSPGMSALVARTVLAGLAGLALGGVLLVAATGHRRQRLAVVVALLGGVLAAVEFTVVVGRAMPAGWGGVPLVAAVVTAVAALVAVRGTAHPSAAAERTHWTPVVVIAVIGVGVWLVARIRLSLLEEFLGGSPSPRRAEVVAAFDEFALISVPMVIALVLGGYAFRYGGRGLARWVIVGAGVSYTFVTIDFLGSEWLVAAVLVTVIAVALGAAAVARADHMVPWDAVGLVLSAWTTFLLVTISESRSFSVGPVLHLGLAASLAFTVGAGAVAGLRSEVARGGGLVNAVLLGIAGLVFSAQIVGVLFPSSDLRYADGYPIGVPVVMTLVAVALALLWGMGKLVERVRRSVYAEASGDAP